MLWSDKIKNWENGTDLVDYPENVQNAFIWETSPITKEMNTEYREIILEHESLDKQIQDYQPFLEHIEDSDNKYVIHFTNLNGTCKLIVPMPRKGKSYANLKFFIDSASLNQKIKFWKKVAKQIRKMLKIHDKVWVSTHGLGVSYLHVRIDTIPKYYVSHLK